MSDPTRESADRRLRRLTRWTVRGRLAEAELELHAWRREPDCPPAVHTLLAALFAVRGRWDTAHDLIRRRRIGEGHRAAVLRLAVLIHEGLEAAAAAVAARLHDRHGGDATARARLDLLSPVPAHGVPAARVEHLAAELSAMPRVIPSLVAAQTRCPDPAQIELLRRSLARVAGELRGTAHQVVIAEAMATLGVLAGAEDDARRWAHRGLRLRPYHAALALVLAQLDDDPAVGPPAADVLEAAVARHPGYPDLRAAHARRRQDQAA